VAATPKAAASPSKGSFSLFFLQLLLYV
jgi:hypothetical protein